MRAPAPARPRAAVVLLAAGSGRRVGAGTNKVLLPLDGIPVLAWSLRTVAALEYVAQVVLATREPDREQVEELVAEHLAGRDVAVVAGGPSRHESEHNALQALSPAIEDGRLDVVAIHDTARPLAGVDLFDTVISVAAEQGGAVPVRPRSNLLCRDARATPPEGRALVGVQTPQAFRARELLASYEHADRDGFVGTDTASCVERYSDLVVTCVPSAATNLKITHPEDLAAAERLRRASS